MSDEHSEFYRTVYRRDNPSDGPHGWIQWKGTDVCMDLHCVCGAHEHHDGDFFYYYQCSACGRRYAVGQNVRLIELTDSEAAYVDGKANGFTKASHPDEPDTPPTNADPETTEQRRPE